MEFRGFPLVLWMGGHGDTCWNDEIVQGVVVSEKFVVQINRSPSWARTG